METNQQKSSDIITTHVGFSLVAGTIPVPLLDVVAVTAIQVDMIRQLAQIYNVDFDKNIGKSLITSLAGTSLARIGASAIKAIPGVGTVIGIGSQAIISGATTYAIGKLFDHHFTHEGNLFNIDTDALKEKFNSFYQEGKDFASKLKKDLETDDPITRLDKMNKLRESGAITDEEYEEIKRKIIDKL